ncbi:hypothetical protein WA1_19015 [Scytonema hofmannii PCC 7110]|uniref:XRE family transcriptional regulator n=1 Tax=Scytonema hofmannii PCC 7110 TaxID=128403 RepID=A0A139XBT9_9CYAN|nr:helix-turn-helix domain-containing protein [Scytonema hofmannii]KYC42092.1 hypothetical protein WA1_19015 [Scytonema hofmannii PCC 7110]
MLDLENVCVERLDSVALEDRTLLPNEPCVYLVLDKNQSVLYVGKSENLKHRWSNHHKLEALMQLEGVKISYLKVEMSLLRKIELALIRAFNPPMNAPDSPRKGIAKLREKTGLTQKQLADLIGVDPSTIRNWERGKGMEMFVRVAKLCELLECQPTDLIEEEIGERDGKESA